MDYNFSFKHFSELSAAELYVVLQLRQNVFIIEQNCIYPDLDNVDLSCFHLMMTNDSDLIGYCRIIEPGIAYNTSSIGRVIIKTAFKGKKLGLQLMKEAILCCKNNWPDSGISISAQAHLKGFYSSLSFVEQGKIYDEDGIPHIKMELK